MEKLKSQQRVKSELKGRRWREDQRYVFRLQIIVFNIQYIYTVYNMYTKMQHTRPLYTCIYYIITYYT